MTTGPIEDRDWPTHLRARIVEPGPAPRLHGFDVQNDLARHYRFGESVLIALTGEAPDEAAGRAFDVAMIFGSAISVLEAPAHAATLARVCGARTSGIQAVAATTLAERARKIYDDLEPAIPRLVVGSLNGMAARLAPRSEAERDAVGRLRRALGAFVARVPALGYDLGLDAALLAVLLACGVRTREQIECALCVAGLATTCAEAFAATPGDHRSYPLDLPKFVYEEARS
ncbi:MAG TPA: hypothetical protein VGH28_12635 [Polyangiaceae bacterium]|jgi:hypothetical protein